jgi:hypothetical protein
VGFKAQEGIYHDIEALPDVATLRKSFSSDFWLRRWNGDRAPQLKASVRRIVKAD